MRATRRFAAGDFSADMLRETKVTHLRRAVAASFFFAAVSLSCLVLFGDVDSRRFFSTLPYSYSLSRLPSIFPSVNNDPVAVSSVACFVLFSRITYRFSFPATCCSVLSYFAVFCMLNLLITAMSHYIYSYNNALPYVFTMLSHQLKCN